MTQTMRTLILMAACGTGSLYAADEKMAAALATSGTGLVAEGKVEKAKTIFYKALAHDADCAEALFELGKILEVEGNTATAAEFFQRATRQFAQNEKAPGVANKRRDAEGRLAKLNPYAGRVSKAFEEYGQELVRITKKTNDSMTLEEANGRVSELKLANYVAPDKMPVIDKPVVAVKDPPKRTGDDEMRPRRTMRGDDERERPAVTVVPPDVERALKAAGWTTITGTWKKVREGVYEVTDGKVEAQKLNGAVDVSVLKGGGTGTIKVLVRNGYKDYSYYDESSYASGFGFVMKGGTCKLFTPYSYYVGKNYSPYMEREANIADANPKNNLMIQVTDNKLEYVVNGKKEKTANYPIAKDGPFTIEVTGTLVIETPRNVGQ